MALAAIINNLAAGPINTKGVVFFYFYTSHVIILTITDQEPRRLEMTTYLLVFLCILLSSFNAKSQTQCTYSVSSTASTCVSSAVPNQCSSYVSGYKSASFPNNVTQDANSALFLYGSKYRIVNCSALANLYVCLSLFPRCSAQAESPTLDVGPPCRSLCQAAVNDCQGKLPNGLAQLDEKCLFSNCGQFPDTNCVSLASLLLMNYSLSTPTSPAAPTTPATEPYAAINGSCPRSDRTYFTPREKTFALGWVAFFSSTCFLSTLITLLTFLLNTSRFEYPWRPVVYLALCFMVHAFGYFLAMLVGRNRLTCPGDTFVQTSTAWTLDLTPCLVVFALLYYSMMASFLWWLALTFCWFLTAVYTWSKEAVARLAPLFHITAWLLPLIMTAVLLGNKVIGADELTAICFIVMEKDNSATFYGLMLGVIVPLLIFLSTGIFFVLAGFVSVLRIRDLLSLKGKKMEKNRLEKLMIRIGIFVTIYIGPASVMIGCYIYELTSKPHWRFAADTTTCTDCSTPNTAVFMTRVFMFLLIGTLTGVWIWSRKTLDSWISIPSSLTRLASMLKINTSRESMDKNIVV